MTKLVLFEDDDTFVEFVEYAVEDTGHTLVARYSTFAQALQGIQSLDPEVGAAIVDGNLSRHVTTGNDGAAIIRELKKINPNIVTIGNTLDNRGVRGADSQAGKDLEVLIGL